MKHISKVGKDVGGTGGDEGSYCTCGVGTEQWSLWGSGVCSSYLIPLLLLIRDTDVGQGYGG